MAARLAPALNEAKSQPYRPFHPHTTVEPLVPGEVYEVAVEIWPTSIVVLAGCRPALTVRGTDYRYDGPVDETDTTHRYPARGVAPFVHTDPEDRPAEVFGGTVTVHTGPQHPPRLLLPLIPTV